MPRSLPALLHKKGVLIAAGTAVLVAVGGGTTAAFASTGESTTAATTVSCHGHHNGFRKDMPAALKADLKELRSMPKGSAERKAERQTIIKDAKAGDFGARYEHVFRTIERHHNHRFGEAISKLPANLQADIKALRELPKGDGQRKAAWQKIEQNAVAGEYGTAIQARAEKRAAHKAACAAPAAPSTSPSTGS